MYKNLKKERDDKVSVQKGASDREKSKPSESSGVRLKRCLALKINCIIEIFFNLKLLFFIVLKNNLYHLHKHILHNSSDVGIMLNVSLNYIPWIIIFLVVFFSFSIIYGQTVLYICSMETIW